MSTILKSHFPMLWDREELMEKIRNDQKLTRVFDSWKKEHQEEFLDFCAGVRGIKLLYDGFFKEIMSAEYTPERLNEFLSLLLGKKVTVKAVLPNDSTRIADESSLLITDIVVELEDGSLANVEVQKIGYNFPGQRSACYSSDMLLRQYKRVRAKKDQNFSYRDIQDVYTIILYEKSPEPFHDFPDLYLHCFRNVPTLVWNWNSSRNFCLSHLTSFWKISTIKVRLLTICLMLGFCFSPRMIRRIF